MRLMIAGGGTGGHLFPGVALVEELRARDPDAEVVFVGTARGIEARVVPELGYDLELIRVSGLKTVGILGALRGLVRIPGALWQARKVIKARAPDAVVGVGGYASGPVVLMARLMGIETAILEQNSIPGLANKILGRFAHKIFLSFDESRRFFKDKKVVMSGNPIRRAIREQLAAAAAPAAATGPPRIFVFGGSQGARFLNQTVPDALELVDVPFTVVHQTGEADLEATREAYERAGIDAECHAFIEDMAAMYRDADLVISRAGATTVAELGVVGRPAILVPYPHAADDHQAINAAELAAAGAAKVFRQGELTAEGLANELKSLLSEPDALARMGDAMKALGRPDAARTIIDWCTENVSQD